MAESIFNEAGYIRPALLLAAYRAGLFPMAMDETGEIGWFSPDPRGVLPLETFHIPHGLKRRLKKNPFTTLVNTAFPEVMDGCADREQTWISRIIRDSYTRLHQLGWAHSVETWQDGELVGGLYGVAIGGAFFGESMFSRRTDASKVALVGLVDRLRSRGFTLLDTQWTTGHLKTFGCVELPRADYLEKLEAALEIEARFADD